MISPTPRLLPLLVLPLLGLTAQPGPEVSHATVRREAGRFFGWPANHGAWQWGDEILVQYRAGSFLDKPPGSHDLDMKQPVTVEQSRSLDGGRTWTHETTPFVVTEPGWGTQGVTDKRPALATPLDFSDPDVIVSFLWEGSLYHSSDRGRTWHGPFALPKLGLHSWQLRTDYLVEGPRTLRAFWSGSFDTLPRDENGGMVFMVLTTDGGLTWTREARVSRRTDATADRHDAVLMPSTVRVSPTKLVTCVRNLSIPPKFGWIECRVSLDNGATWNLQSMPVGDEAGTTPPALTRLSDGRLVLTYGHRKPLRGPTSIRAKISRDDGRTWGEEIILRSGGGDEDIGYTRNLLRPDGRLITFYYWNNDEKTEREIAATIWAPPAR